MGKEAKQEQKLHLRIFIALLSAALISIAAWSVFHTIGENISVIQYKRQKEAEEVEVNKLVEATRKKISAGDYIFQEAANLNLFDTLENYEVYIAGTDGKIYLKGRKEGIAVSEVDVKLDSLYIYDVAYADGHGFLIIKPKVENSMFGNYSIYVALGALVVFILLAYHFIYRQLKGLPGFYYPDHEVTVVKRENLDETYEATKKELELKYEQAEIEKPYTDVNVLLKQYIGEMGYVAYVEESEAPVYISGDLEVFMQVLECCFQKAEQLMGENGKIKVTTGIDDKYIKVRFNIEAKEAVLGFSVEETSFLSKSLKALKGRFFTEEIENLFFINLELNK